MEKIVIFKQFIVRIVYFGLGILLGYVTENYFDSNFNTNDEALTPFFKEFISDAQKYNAEIDLERFKKIKYQFKTLKFPIAGQCNYLPARITINPSFFYGSTRLIKKLLVYHEIGHCYCRRGHNNEINLRTTCPKSIMHANIPTSDCIMRYNKDYIKEFFENC